MNQKILHILRVRCFLKLFLLFFFVFFVAYFFVSSMTFSGEGSFNLDILYGATADDLYHLLPSSISKYERAIFIFLIKARVLLFRSSIKFGEYSISYKETFGHIVDMLFAGDVLLYKVFIPEGITSLRVHKILMAYDFLVGDIDVPEEGSILPDTYFVSKGQSRKSVIGIMNKAQRAFVDKIWKESGPDRLVSSKKDLIILASMIEREAAEDSERPIIASVFLNRLEQRMKLQSDPTALYGIERIYSRSVKSKDLLVKHGWNTYKINGLPPTPICNPSKKSILAALNPAKTDFLFFVAKGDNSHAFSRTFDEHLKNIEKFLR